MRNRARHSRERPRSKKDRVAEHRRHTGHETRATRPSWYGDDSERIEWWVNCNTCKEAPDFRDEAIARRYFERHEAHTGHEADSIERRVFEVE